MAVKRWIETIAERRGFGCRAVCVALGVARRAVCGVARLFGGLQRSGGPGSRSDRMELVGSLALGNRRQLLLVVCGERRFLVGVGADSVSSLLAIETLHTEDPKSLPPVRKGPVLVTRRTRKTVFQRGIETGSGVWQ